MDKKKEYLLYGAAGIGGLGVAWFLYEHKKAEAIAAQNAANNAPLSYVAGDPQPTLEGDAGGGDTNGAAWTPPNIDPPPSAFTLPTFDLPPLAAPQTITPPATVTVQPWTPPQGSAPELAAVPQQDANALVNSLHSAGGAGGVWLNTTG